MSSNFIKMEFSAFIVSVIVTIGVAIIFGKRTAGYFSITSIRFIISGLSGTYAVLHIGKMNFAKKLDTIFEVIGKTTIVIYGTHHIYYVAVGVLIGIKNFTTTPIWAGVLMLMVVAILEIPIIYIVNRWLLFLAGKLPKNRNIY